MRTSLKQLVLICPYDPAARFHVGHAMQRNKLIYALADTALVVSSDYQKGGTWTGAVEQLEKLEFVPVYVRANGDMGPGLEGLRKRGAVSWPDPKTPDALEEILDTPRTRVVVSSEQATLPLGVRDEPMLTPIEEQKEQSAPPSAPAVAGARDATPW